ncbi:SEC-C metal-binding domain-containing protein [Pseudomonas protegens]|uniref:SEC-C metal-binding domain-containing protein n=1 Tax=Pseudomonas protegens TaxID=380021 RepID=UPI001F2823AD|nr:SEC-C metal-binding domain-containing protein [Pseudomonas protegens]
MKKQEGLTTPVNPASSSLDFARAISPKFDLVYVQVEPTLNSLPNECYSNVARMVEERGGRSILGWQIWEWKGYFAEAESHAIWKSPTGELLDVTPKLEKQILFIEDPENKFIGNRVNNIRSALLDAEIVHDFIEAGNAKHALFGHVQNGTRLETWKVVIGERLDHATHLLPNLFKKKANTNQQCPCGSGLRYHDCHRAEIKKTIEMARNAISEK